jgi:hypothetical protein
LLALTGVVRTFSSTSGEVFQALDRPQLRVYTEITHFALLVPALAVGAHWQGLEGPPRRWCLPTLRSVFPCWR